MSGFFRLMSCKIIRKWCISKFSFSCNHYREVVFLVDLEQIQVVNPAEVKLVADHSPFYKRALLYLKSQWRQQIPTDSNLHIGHQAAMDLMPYQLDLTKLSLQRPRKRILISDTVALVKCLKRVFWYLNWLPVVKVKEYWLLLSRVWCRSSRRKCGTASPFLWCALIPIASKGFELICRQTRVCF